VAASFNIESIVQKPTWKQILLDLIDSKRLDPWNIDLLAVADGFMKKVQEMHKPDFVIHANVILAAAILLRYKSDYLKFLQYQSTVPEFAGEPDPMAFEGEVIPQLSLASRIPPKRQITLNELVEEMERIIKYESSDRMLPRLPKGSVDEIVNIELNEFDIEKKMNELLNTIHSSVDSEGWVLFSKIVANQDKTETIYSLLSVLHLTQERKIDLLQDELFGEIFIHFLDKDNSLSNAQRSSEGVQ